MMSRPFTCLLAACFAASLLVSACGGDPHEKTLPRDLSNYKNDLKSALEQLTPQEREILASFAKRYNSGTAGKLEDGITVRQALAQQREYDAAQARKEADAQAAKERVAQDRDRWRRLFEDALTAAYVGKTLDHTGFSGDFLTVTVSIKNSGSREIASFKARVEFFNESGGEISHEVIDYKKPIAAGKSITEAVRMYRMPEGIYKNPATSNDKMRFHFKPLQIVFASGDKLVLPKEYE